MGLARIGQSRRDLNRTDPRRGTEISMEYDAVTAQFLPVVTRSDELIRLEAICDTEKRSHGDRRDGQSASWGPLNVLNAQQILPWPRA